MNILVIGGTGTVGSEVVKRLQQSDQDNLSIRIMTRSKEKISGLSKGTEGVVGDMDDKNSLEPAFQEIDKVFLITTPESQDETQSGLNAVEVAKAAGIDKIVYMSAHKLEEFTDAPHLYGKIPIEYAVKSSGIEYTLLRPNGFFQNDYWFKEGILEHGIYGQPMGEIGLSRVDVRDIAEAAVHVLLTDKFNGKTYPLVGPDVIDGETTAELYSRYLGSQIIYTGDDIETWAEYQRQYLPERIVSDLRSMYKHFLENGYLASDDDFDKTREVLGKDPKSYEAFVKEVAAQWEQEELVS